MIQNELDNLLQFLLQSEIALVVTPTSVTDSCVTWHALNPAAPFLLDHFDASIGSYRNWAENGAYSALLFDGALLQVTYDVGAGQISGHRLCYVPPPVHLDEDLLQSEAVVDVLDAGLAGNTDEIRMRSPIRFDYDLVAATVDHPAAHMTLNSMDCRIPCTAPLRLGHFVSFVFRNFYPSLWHGESYLKSMSVADWGKRSITPEETKSLHVSWVA